MKKFTLLVLVLFCTLYSNAQLPPKSPYPFDIKQIHSGHSLTDPLFSNWPGQYVNLVASLNGMQGWQAMNSLVGKSTTPGSNLRWRWENPTSTPDARLDIDEWELLSTTERVPLCYEGGNSQQWYQDCIQEQKTHLSLFVNNSWNNGNHNTSGVAQGAPTLLWTTWTNIDNSNGPWRQMLDIQGAEFERMQDYANANRPAGAPPVYMIPGHKMMARLYDDIQSGLVPGITNISDFFSDNIHVNNLGGYAMSMIHYACVFNLSPVGLSNNLLPGAPSGTLIPTPAQALYLQNMVWQVVTAYSGRTGISGPLPVEWLEVNSSLNPQQQATIKWMVQERAVKEYKVEKSEDGLKYEVIATLPSEGDGIRRYQYTEAAPLQEKTFYRIQQRDQDGQSAYAPIQVLAPVTGKKVCTISPNPTTQYLRVQSEALDQTMTLLDVRGATLQIIPIQQPDFTIDLGAYESGLYFLKTPTGVHKVIKY